MKKKENNNVYFILRDTEVKAQIKGFLEKKKTHIKPDKTVFPVFLWLKSKGMPLECMEEKKTA